MQPLNPIDAISPAFARTRLVLFSPFRFGRSWKLAATSYLGFCATMFFPFPLIALCFLPMARRSGGTGMVALLLAIALIGTAFFLVFFYLFARLKFAFFDIVLNRGQFVAPAWRKYGRQTWQWIGLSLVLGLVAMIVMGAPAVAYFRQIFDLFKQMQSLGPGQPPPFGLMAGFYAGYFLFYALFALALLICSTLAAFLIPSLALEQVSLAEAFRRLGRFTQREPGQFFAFLAVRALIGIVGYIAQMACFYILLLVQLLVFGIVAAIVGLLLHLAGVPTPVLIGLGITLAIVLYLFNGVYVLFLAFGTVLTFSQAHTLYFLAGRYALLGDLLQQSTPPPPPPPLAYYTPSPSPPPQPL